MENEFYDHSHYDGGILKIECLDFARHLNFLAGNVFKYVWRAGRKTNEIEDLRKALSYIEECYIYDADVTDLVMTTVLLQWLDRIEPALPCWKKDILKDVLQGFYSNAGSRISERINELEKGKEA